MSRPFMPFYSGDWMRDTAHLDDTQERAYFRLVMFYWDRGSLPADERQLARITHLTPKKWAKNRSVLQTFFDISGDGCWLHKRIEKELEKSEKFLEKQRANGAKPKAKHGPAESQELSQNETRARVPQPHPIIDDEIAREARAKEDFDRIENACREASGTQNSPSPGLLSLAPILGLIDRGFSLESEIIPALRAKPNPRAGSWKYFVGQIEQFRADRIASALRPDAPIPQSTSPPRPSANGWAQLAMESREKRNELGSEKRLSGETVPRVPVRIEDGPRPGDIDHGELPRNPATILIGRSFNRM